MSTQSKNPVYRQTEVSFKQLTDSNQSSVDDMAVIRGHGWVQSEYMESISCELVTVYRIGASLANGERREMADKREDSMHQL